jgi:hypothetical protein
VQAAQIWFDLQEKPLEKPPIKSELNVDNGAGEHLKLLSSDVSDSVTADGRHIQSWGVMLEAKAPGRFNLSIGADSGRGSQALPVVIVPKHQPLPVLAPQSLHTQQSGSAPSSSYDRHTPKTLVMRVGDVVILPVTSGSSIGNPPTEPHSRHVKLLEEPFVAKAGDLGFVGAPE